MKRQTSFLLALMVFLGACSKEPQNELLDKATQKAEAQDASFRVKDFIWKGLNQYYLWQEQVGDLSDTRFERSLTYTNATSEKYVHFLRKFNSPEGLFHYLLHSDDRFSFIVRDIDELENSFQGIFLSTGMHYALA